MSALGNATELSDYTVLDKIDMSALIVVCYYLCCQNQIHVRARSYEVILMVDVNVLKLNHLSSYPIQFSK